MGAAAYIGRVGALAVSLGVGTAIATGYGIAAADDTSSAGSTVNTSNATGSTGSNSTPTEKTGTTQTQPTQPPTATQPSPSKTITTTATTQNTTSKTVADGVVVSAQTNTGTSTITPTTNTPASATTPTTEAAPSTETTAPQPTAEAPQPTKTEEPAKPTGTQEVPPSAPPSKSSTANTPSPAIPTTAKSALTVESFSNPTTNTPPAGNAAALANFSDLAPPSPTMVAAQVTQQTEKEPTTPVTSAPQNPLAAVVNVVSSVVNWVLSPFVSTAPTSPAQPPLIWTLLAFARREFENFFGLVSPDNASANVNAQTTSLALAAAPTALTAVNPRPGFPIPGQQLSPSTNFVDWVTGNFPPNDTANRFSVWGTDVGTMWDNGIPDDPTTPIDEHQVLMAVGDTFSGPNMTGTWRPNTLFRSSDTNLAAGMSIPNGQWFNGNMFGGAPLGPNSTTARQIIFADGLPAGVTLIPTAGISVPTPGTQFGATQYLSFMSVTQWGSPGYWTTNYSAIASSTDNGENWKVAPTSVRYNQPWSGNQNFQQSAFVRPGDGYVYMYGTPNGRQGAAYVARVAEQDILDTTKYDYYSAGSYGWFWSTPAGWYRNSPAAATPVFGQDAGACGIANPGNQVSEMSVQYNKTLNKYVTLYGDQFNNIVMRTSDTPQGAWGSAKVLLTQQNGGIYAPMMHPWSPSTLGTGTDLYWNLSLSSEYNIMLMRTDLTKV